MRKSPTKFVALVLSALCPATAAAQITFEEITEEVGLVQPLAGIMGHGGAAGDIDNDGRIDLFVGGFCDRPDEAYAPANGPVPTRLLRNTTGGFVHLKQEPVTFLGRASGAVFADLDNNGTLELYVANNARPMSNHPDPPRRAAQRRTSNLFRNDNGQFVDISAASGACPPTLTSARNIGVLDYNGDGLLDLFVVEDIFTRDGAEPRSILFENTGGLKFVDANEKAGLPEDIYGLGLAVSDLNEDGRPDFFVPHSNRMFLSGPGGKYREPESLKRTFAWAPVDREEWPCGAAFGDLNRDGLLDLVLAIHYEKARNKVYLNRGLKDGVPQFEEVTEQVGLGHIVPQKTPHVELQDFDNDGWLDIYMSAGWLEGGEFTPLVYRNEGLTGGLPRFAPPREVKGEMVYFPAGPSGDFDSDGRVDLFLINWFQGNRSRLMKNTSPQRHWLNVRVAGQDRLNRMGIGAQVRLYPAGKLGQSGALLGFQEITTGYGYASGQPAVAHFGLDDVEKVDLAVKLPGGDTIERTDVAADQTLVIPAP